MARTATATKKTAKKTTRKAVTKRATKRVAKQETPAQILELVRRAEQQQREEKKYSFERTYTIEFKPLVREKEGQVTLSELRKMSFTERERLWKQLNEKEPKFVGIVQPSEVHITRHMSKVEAVARGLIPEKKPHKNALYCPYCADWNLFKKWNDYDKCIGCGISTTDFYTRTENKLW